MKSQRKTKAKKSPRKAKRKLGRPKTAAFVPPTTAAPVRLPAPPEVKVVDLPPTGVLQVEFPPGVKPVVAIDSDRNVLEIVPVRRLEPRKKSWWESLFS